MWVDGIDGVGGVHVDQRTALDLLLPVCGRIHWSTGAWRGWPPAPTLVRPPPPCLPSGRTTGRPDRGNGSNGAGATRTCDLTLGFRLCFVAFLVFYCDDGLPGHGACCNRLVNLTEG